MPVKKSIEGGYIPSPVFLPLRILAEKKLNIAFSNHYDNVGVLNLDGL